ncbi:MAG TPA: hypothetical protein D7I11_00695 [Candidatus Poseidoniales archaeon]|nr:MAG TPA: hypothetical protein D7I11_00695 [Candidatus Poseidoniales archaeon]
MAAPRRKVAPVRPTASTAPAGPVLSGGVMEGAAPDPSTITMVRPNQKFNQDDLFLMKLSQVVMLCIGFASIWIAIG